MRFWIFFLGSFLCVALGQPYLVPWIGIAASAIGFALFWRAMCELTERRWRFWLAVSWFGLVQAVQISWMTSQQYMGGGILFIYGFLLFALGLQFGMLSLFLGTERPISLSRSLAISGCWVLFEWVRLFPLTGFPWNPVGLALADSSYSIQFASLFGIYGLSFWVIFVNLLAFNGFRSPKWRIGWAICALFPYMFGVLQKTWVEHTTTPSKPLTVALVQTALLPEQKEWFPYRSERFIPPLDQWNRILTLFQKRKGPIDLIVFPEAAFPLGAYRPFYPLKFVRSIWQLHFGDLNAFPPLTEPMAAARRMQNRTFWKVTNAYLAQALSNQFQARVIIGLDDEEEKQYCNAAFHFQPRKTRPERYEKQVLMPIVEYVPLPNWQFLAEFIAHRYGIESSFFPGKEIKVFPGSAPIGVSICAEETYSSLVRNVRLKGAEFLVTVSNDVWFPHSRLPHHHFQHGRVRAAENGMYLFRSSNTGITGVIDCFGHPLVFLEPSEITPEILFASLPTRSFSTLYTFWGDWAILSLSGLFFLLFWRKKLP